MDMELNDLRIWILQIGPHVLMVKNNIDCGEGELSKLIDMLFASFRIFELLWQDVFVRSVPLIALSLLLLSGEELIGWLFLYLVGLSVIIV